MPPGEVHSPLLQRAERALTYRYPVYLIRYGGNCQLRSAYFHAGCYFGPEARKQNVPSPSGIG
jgi:hypothetical protein